MMLQLEKNIPAATWGGKEVTLPCFSAGEGYRSKSANSFMM